MKGRRSATAARCRSPGSRRLAARTGPTNQCRPATRLGSNAGRERQVGDVCVEPGDRALRVVRIGVERAIADQSRNSKRGRPQLDQCAGVDVGAGDDAPRRIGKGLDAGGRLRLVAKEIERADVPAGARDVKIVGTGALTLKPAPYVLAGDSSRDTPAVKFRTIAVKFGALAGAGRRRARGSCGGYQFHQRGPPLTSPRPCRVSGPSSIIMPLGSSAVVENLLVFFDTSAPK